MLLAVAENVIETMPTQTFYYVLFGFFGILSLLLGSNVALVVYIFTTLKDTVKDVKASVPELGAKMDTKLQDKATNQKVDSHLKLVKAEIKGLNTTIDINTSGLKEDVK
jgi:hypothetical protein